MHGLQWRARGDTFPDGRRPAGHPYADRAEFSPDRPYPQDAFKEDKRVGARWLGSGDVPLDLIKKGVPGATVGG